MDLEKLTEESLAKKVLEKHEKFLRQYRRKLKDMERLAMLEDKIDQLSHWMENNGEDASKLSSRKEKTEQELIDLESRLGAYSHRKTIDVKGKIKEHENASAFWKNK